MKRCLLVLMVVLGLNAEAQIYDSVTFETPDTNIIISPSAGNLWQIGHPQKTFFNNAHAGSKAIVTDTLNSYPANDTSTFICVIPHSFTSYTCFTCMDFWHKYDMDSIGDKGIIEASYDGGSSWLPLKDTSTMSMAFSWDYDYHEATGNYTAHPIITTGKSDGWIESHFCWQWWIPVIMQSAGNRDTIIMNPDSLMIRFTFISDTVLKSKEGWMIDNIISTAADWSMCSGIDTYSADNDISTFPNPFTNELTIGSTKYQVQSIKLYDVLGQCIYQSSINDKQYTLDLTGISKGIYFIEVNTGKEIVRKKIIKQ